MSHRRRQLTSPRIETHAILMGVLGQRTLVVRTLSVAPDKPRLNDADRQNIRQKAEEKSYRYECLWYPAHKAKNETYYPNAPRQRHRDRSRRTWGHEKIRSHAVFVGLTAH
jgi:hypothetical protein